jgi:hypothetical protein
MSKNAAKIDVNKAILAVKGSIDFLLFDACFILNRIYLGVILKQITYHKSLHKIVESCLPENSIRIIPTIANSFKAFLIFCILVAQILSFYGEATCGGIGRER